MCIGVNLLPWRAQKAAQGRRRHRRQSALLAALAVALVLLARVPLAGMESAQHRINSTLEKRVHEQEAALEQLALLRRENARFDKQLQLQQSLGDQRRAWLDRLNAVLNALPQEAVLLRLEQDANIWRIDGFGSDVGMLPEALMRLRDHPAFSGARIERIEPANRDTAPGRMHFVITAESTAESGGNQP